MIQKCDTALIYAWYKRFGTEVVSGSVSGFVSGFVSGRIRTFDMIQCDTAWYNVIHKFVIQRDTCRSYQELLLLDKRRQPVSERKTARIRASSLSVRIKNLYHARYGVILGWYDVIRNLYRQTRSKRTDKLDPPKWAAPPWLPLIHPWMWVSCMYHFCIIFVSERMERPHVSWLYHVCIMYVSQSYQMCKIRTDKLDNSYRQTFCGSLSTKFSKGGTS